MKIIIDSDIPFIEGVFEEYFSVFYKKGIDINSSDVKDADALVVRTRTKCNAQLLEGSNVKIIATATIGLDHIDLDYCKNNNIKVVSSAGCNAGGVLQYVYTALYYLAQEKGFALPAFENDVKLTMGVIGVGNVGSKIADFGEYLGFNVLRNDPIKEKEQTLAFNNGQISLNEFKDYYSLDYVLKNSDIITIHVYLDSITKGFVNDKFVGELKNNVIFINSSRGEVVCEQALLNNLNKFSSLVIDVWNNEPNINKELLQVADIATPHIAGYSYEGKLNGSQMAINQIGDFFNIHYLANYIIDPISPNNNYFSFNLMNQADITAKMIKIFPIFEDSNRLKKSIADFESLRNNYNYRREFYARSKTT